MSTPTGATPYNGAASYGGGAAYGAGAVPPGYGAGAVPPGYGAGAVPPGYGAGAVPPGYGYQAPPLGPESLVFSGSGSKTSLGTNMVGGVMAVIFVIGGVWSLVVDKGSVGVGIGAILLGLLVGASVLVLSRSRCVMDASGVRVSVGSVGHTYPWPRSRTAFFAHVKDKPKNGRLTAEVTVAMVAEDGHLVPIPGLAWMGPNLESNEAKAVQECQRIWDWAVARGYTYESGQYTEVWAPGRPQQARAQQERRFGLRP